MKRIPESAVKAVFPLETVIVVRPEQAAKTPSLMSVTFSGILKVVKPVHCLITNGSSVVMFAGSVRAVKPVQL